MDVYPRFHARIVSMALHKRPSGTIGRWVTSHSFKWEVRFPTYVVHGDFADAPRCGPTPLLTNRHASHHAIAQIQHFLERRTFTRRTPVNRSRTYSGDETPSSLVGRRISGLCPSIP